MFIQDTATSLMRVEARPTLGQQIAYNTTQSNKLYEAQVVKVTVAENFESTVFVYVYNTKETYLAFGGGYHNASSVSSTGSYRPYFVGDKVLVSFLYGDAGKPVIMQRVYEQAGAGENMLEAGNPVPTKNKVVGSGQAVKPNPLSVEPAALAQGGFLAVDVYPMLLI
jgi:hypothetical protein